MNKFLAGTVIFVGAFLGLLCTREEAAPPNNRSTFLPLPESENQAAPISPVALRKDVEQLCSVAFGGRMSGHAGCELAEKYIRQKYAHMGLVVTEQEFDVRKVNPDPDGNLGTGRARNLFAVIPGQSRSQEIVGLSAHYDHIGQGPQMSRSQNTGTHFGADDNASGTALILAVAEKIAGSNKKHARTIVVMHFCGEELGLIGSKHYCKKPIFPTENPSLESHVGVVNVDMVGNLKQSRSKGAKTAFSPFLDLQRFPFAADICLSGGGGSDHAPFIEKKVPAIMVHTGLTEVYHTPEDTPSRLDYDGMAQVAEMVAGLVGNLADSEKRPSVNSEKTLDLPPFDHGTLPFPAEH